MLIALTIVGVVVGLLMILFGLASAFLPRYGTSSTSQAPGIISAVSGAIIIIAAVLFLAVT